MPTGGAKTHSFVRKKGEYLVQSPHMVNAGKFGSRLLVVVSYFVTDHPAECFTTVSAQTVPVV